MTDHLLTPKALADLARPDHGFEHDHDSLWNELAPGLWMGGTADKDDIRFEVCMPSITPAHFDTVITLYAWAGPVDWYVKEIRLGFFDHCEVDLDLHDLAQAVRAAHQDWIRGKRVLIRCQAGWNRSGLVSALVLMLNGESVEDAIDLLRENRSPYALCNPDFVDWLHAEGPGFIARMSDQPSLMAA